MLENVFRNVEFVISKISAWNTVCSRLESTIKCIQQMPSKNIYIYSITFCHQTQKKFLLRLFKLRFMKIISLHYTQWFSSIIIIIVFYIIYFILIYDYRIEYNIFFFCFVSYFFPSYLLVAFEHSFVILRYMYRSF